MFTKFKVRDIKLLCNKEYWPGFKIDPVLFFNVDHWSGGACSTLKIDTKSRGIYTQGNLNLFSNLWSPYPLKNEKKIKSFRIELALRDLNKITWNVQVFLRGWVKGVKIHKDVDCT